MSRTVPTVAMFCTPEMGHFQALRGVIAEVAAHGLSPVVWTHASFREEVIRCGGQFVDLFGQYPLDEADAESRPIPCRYVSFAGYFAERVIADVRAVRPALVVYETFSVIAPVVARALAIPYVNVCVNHNPHPARTLAALARDPRVQISARCQIAAERLRDEFGLADASPFSYVTSLSPLLNLYCEPAEFLGDADRAAFAPLAFFGCLPRESLAAIAPPQRLPTLPLRLYVSFGTVVWRYFAAEASAAMQTIAAACAEMDQVRAVISLGSPAADSELGRSLAASNVEVRPFVNQVEELRQADAFVTHHGLNSTHEAIAQRVPMLSYPFFSDQPALARKCQELGLAIPLGPSPRAPLTVGGVKEALKNLQLRQAELHANLERARGWELRTMVERSQAMQRLLELIKTPAAEQPLREC